MKLLKFKNIEKVLKWYLDDKNGYLITDDDQTKYEPYFSITNDLMDEVISKIVFENKHFDKKIFGNHIKGGYIVSKKIVVKFEKDENDKNLLVLDHITIAEGIFNYLKLK